MKYKYLTVSLIILSLIFSAFAEEKIMKAIPATPEDEESFLAEQSKVEKTEIEFPNSEELLTPQDVEVFLRTYNAQGDPAERKFHVFVDEKDPFVHTDDRKPILLKNLSEGGHLIRVLAVDQHGLTYSLPQNLAIVHFFVIRKDFQNMYDPKQPMLIMNSPFSGPIELESRGKLAMDYVVQQINVKKIPIKIRYKIDQKTTTTIQPSPIWITNLSPGRHTIEMELLDDKDIPLLGKFTKCQRTFEILRVLKPMQLQKDLEIDEVLHPDLIP
jgi:hypothetical protein